MKVVKLAVEKRVRQFTHDGIDVFEVGGLNKRLGRVDFQLFELVVRVVRKLAGGNDHVLRFCDEY